MLVTLKEFSLLSNIPFHSIYRYIKNSNIQPEDRLGVKSYYNKDDFDDLVHSNRFKDNPDYFRASDIIIEGISKHNIWSYFSSRNIPYESGMNVRYYENEHKQAIVNYFTKSKYSSPIPIHEIKRLNKLRNKTNQYNISIRRTSHDVRPMNKKFKTLCSNVWVSKRLIQVTEYNTDARCVC